MPDTSRSQTALQALFADNTAGAISAQDLRDFVVSVLNTTDTPVSAFAKTLLDDADASTARTTLGAAAASHTHTISQVTDAGTAAALNVAASGNASSSEVVKGNDTRLSDSRTPTTHTHAQSDVTGLVSALAGKAATVGGSIQNAELRNPYINDSSVNRCIDFATQTTKIQSQLLEINSLAVRATSGTIPIDDNISMTEGHAITDGTAPSINPFDRQLIDSDGDTTCTWDSRELRNTGGAATVDWENCELYSDYSSSISIDWRDKILVGVTGTAVLDWTGTFNSSAAISHNDSENTITFRKTIKLDSVAIDVGGGGYIDTDGTGVRVNGGLKISGGFDLNGNSISNSGGDITCSQLFVASNGLQVGSGGLNTNGTVIYDGTVDAGTVVIGGSLRLSNSAQNLDCTGGNLRMNNGSGSGGGTIYTDGGNINLNGGSVNDGNEFRAKYVGIQDSSDAVMLTIQKGSGQSLNMTEWRDYENQPIASVNSEGGAAFRHSSVYSLVLADTTTPSSPTNGQIYFDGTNFLGWNGSTWLQLNN